MNKQEYRRAVLWDELENNHKDEIDYGAIRDALERLKPDQVDKRAMPTPPLVKTRKK